MSIETLEVEVLENELGRKQTITYLAGSILGAVVGYNLKLSNLETVGLAAFFGFAFTCLFYNPYSH